MLANVEHISDETREKTRHSRLVVIVPWPVLNAEMLSRAGTCPMHEAVVKNYWQQCESGPKHNLTADVFGDISHLACADEGPTTPATPLSKIIWMADHSPQPILGDPW